MKKTIAILAAVALTALSAINTQAADADVTKDANGIHVAVAVKDGNVVGLIKPVAIDQITKIGVLIMSKSAPYGCHSESNAKLDEAGNLVSADPITGAGFSYDGKTAVGYDLSKLPAGTVCNIYVVLKDGSKVFLNTKKTAVTRNGKDTKLVAAKDGDAEENIPIN